MEQQRLNIKANKIGHYLVFILVLSWAQSGYSYVRNQTKAGIPLHWPGTNTLIDIYVNYQNTQSPLISESLLNSIAASSIAQWKDLSLIGLRQNSTAGKNQDELNEIYFSSEPSIFNGTSVVGVTLVGFSESSGEILSADIVLNDTFPFSTSSIEASYLGNVITHELGHFLGLGHGQVAGSSMFYSLSRGQNKISADDKAGLYSIYPNGNTNLGMLTGTIVGSKKLANVFGAHVQALSVKTGKVMGAAISEIDGKFKINGLPKDDQYLIYTSPIKQMGLPSNYANARSDFCQSSTKYRGSFFQSCGANAEGFPEAVKLNASSIDVGNITIRCGLDTPPEYIQNKSMTPSSFDLNSYTNSGLGGSFVGFFSAYEIQQSSPAHLLEDYFQIDFSHINDWNTISTNPSLFVELKVINQPFYSPLKVNVNVKNATGNYDVTPKYIQEPGGRVNIDTITRIPINRVVSSDNNFEIKITPSLLTDAINTSAGIPFTKVDLFSSYTELQENLYFYLVTATIVKANGDGTYTQVSSKEDLLSDNSICPDAINTYALTNFSASGPSTSSDRKSAAGCGTVVDTKNGSGGGPGGFMVGLVLCFIISYGLSRYSKMA